MASTRVLKAHPRALVALVLVAALGLAGLAAVQAATSKIDAVAFHDAMRKLWEDHVTWTRLVIVDFAFATPDTGPTVDRLLQNQVDIGNAIKPFYGDAAGNQLASLLRTHILLAAQILTAAKAGDTATLNDAVARWYANASDIAAFLNAANPKNWPLDSMKDMMKEHLDLTLAEAVAQLTGDYALSISGYDKVHLQILHMADMLSSGIVLQFPAKFTNAEAVVGEDD